MIFQIFIYCKNFNLFLKIYFLIHITLGHYEIIQNVFIAGEENNMD